jgi:hypothetical protein
MHYQKNYNALDLKTKFSVGSSASGNGGFRSPALLIQRLLLRKQTLKT